MAENDESVEFAEPTETQESRPAPRSLVTPPGSGAPAGSVLRTITDRAVIPVGDSSLEIGARPMARPQSTPTVTLSRKKLDDISMSGEAYDLEISVERYAPTHWNGSEVPTGHIMKSPIMPYGQLERAIADCWGGGYYRIWMLNKSTGSWNQSYVPMLIEIPVGAFPPKTARGSTDIPLAPLAKKEGMMDEAEAFKEEMRLSLLSAQADSARARRLKARVDALMEQKQLERLMKSGLGDEDESKKLAAQMQEERKQMQEQFQSVLAKIADTKNKSDTDERFERLEGAITKLAEAVASPRKEENGGMKSLEILVQGMQNNTQAMLAGMQNTITAMGGQKSPEMLQVLERMADNAVKANSRDSAGQFALMKEALSIASSNRDTSKLDPLEYIKLGKEMHSDAVKTIRDLGLGGGGDDDSGGGGGGGGGDWDPEQGVLQNVGKLIFYGLKALANRAAEDPDTLTALGKMTGLSGREVKDDQRLMQAANRIAAAQQRQLPATPGPVVFSTPQPVYQQPMRPAYPVAQPHPAAPPQQVVFQTPPPVQAPQAVPAPVQVVPAVPAPVPAPPVPVPTGLAAAPVEESPVQVQTVPEAKVEAQPPAEPAAPPVPDPDEDSEDRLKMRVSEIMAMAIEDLKDAIEVHEWPAEAKKCWNKRFLMELATEQDEAKRRDMIQSKCDPVMWDEVWGHIHEEASEARKNFDAAIRGLVALVNEEEAEKRRAHTM